MEVGRTNAYGAWTSIVNFYDKNEQNKWPALWTHGKRRASLASYAGDAGQQKANTEAKLKKILAPIHSTLYMGCGHYHRVVLRPPTKLLYLTSKGRELVSKYTHPCNIDGWYHPDQRWYGASGGFMRQFLMGDEFPNDSLETLEPISYSEREVYEPTEMGIIALNIGNYGLDYCETIML